MLVAQDNTSEKYIHENRAELDGWQLSGRIATKNRPLGSP